MIRYRFSEFTLSPQRRLLVKDGREVPLIPRYFDLLVLLIERRHEAVHRREIFDKVWADASVSDSALSQAIRTIRRTLDDDSKEPRFIRTVSRHGYRFVLTEVIEEEEDDGVQAVVAQLPPVPIVEAEPEAGSLWSRASLGGAVAGFTAGGIGGLILAVAPGSTATIAIAPVLAVIGGAGGAVGGAGVGAGLSIAEARLRAYGAMGLIAGAALGGGLVGTAAQWLVRWGLDVLLGVEVPVGGGFEGVVIGAAAGAGYVLATANPLRSALISGLVCGAAGVALTLAGYPLVGGTIHTIADAVHGSRATFAPLGHLIGEPGFGPVSRAIAAFGEAAVFGLGLSYGILRRSHSNLT